MEVPGTDSCLGVSHFDQQAGSREHREETVVNEDGLGMEGATENTSLFLEEKATSKQSPHQQGGKREHVSALRPAVK